MSVDTDALVDEIDAILEKATALTEESADLAERSGALEDSEEADEQRECWSLWAQSYEKDAQASDLWVKHAGKLKQYYAACETLSDELAEKLDEVADLYKQNAAVAREGAAASKQLADYYGSDEEDDDAFEAASSAQDDAYERWAALNDQIEAVEEAIEELSPEDDEE